MCAWGRAGKLALADLRELGHTSPALVRLDDTQVQSPLIFLWRGCALANRKRSLQMRFRKPALLFTDGALEYDGDEPCATIGAVCIFPDGSTKCQRLFWMFGEKVARLMLLGWWNFMLALSSKVSGPVDTFCNPFHQK